MDHSFGRSGHDGLKISTVLNVFKESKFSCLFSTRCHLLDVRASGASGAPVVVSGCAAENAEDSARCILQQTDSDILLLRHIAAADSQMMT
jgi:hypothetical protein